MASPDPNRPLDRSPWLRRGEQSLIALVVAGALGVMAFAWIWQGGHRGQLIEIERAEPVNVPYVVDINSASWPELAQLPEIGETLARRIVESRAEQGAFQDHEDLRRVRGIGPRTLEQIRPYLRPMAPAENVAGQ